jgi:hypothetical protein
MQSDDLSRPTASACANVLDRLAGHRFWEKSDEIAGVPRFEGDADLAVGLEAADTGAMASARVDDDKWPPRQIDMNSSRRDDTRQGVVDRPIELAAVGDELDLVFEHMRDSFRQVRAVLIASLAQNVPKQYAALRRVNEVLGISRE